MGAREKVAQDIVDTMQSIINDETFTTLQRMMGSLKDLTSAISGNIPDMIITLAESILIVYVLWHLVDSVLQDKRDPDSIFKDLALLFFYGYITKHTPELINALAAVGDNIFTAANNWMKVDGKAILEQAFRMERVADDTTTFQAELAKKNLFILILDSVLYKTIVRLIAWVTQTIALVCVFTIKVEVILRTVFLPLSVAGLPEGGVHSASFRFILKYVGAFVQFGVISIALQAYPLIVAASILTPGENFAVSFAACAFAVVGLCMKGSSLANEIVGAA